jgi:uncharacterized repeat protein (TIGR01451 family)/LPXTG-motif cell wall-anchored protein
MTQTVVPAMPGLSITKSSSGGDLKVGTVIDYTFAVANTGNLTVSGIALDDPLTSDEACPQDTLLPGEQMLCTATYKVTQQDIDAGSVDNTATVSGTTPLGPIENEGSNVFPAAPEPKLAVAKSGLVKDSDGDGRVEVGEMVDFTIVVTNTGNVTVSDVSVDDPLTGVPSCDGEATLAPGEFIICTVSYSLTQEDVDAGFVSNTATATGKDPSGADVSGKGSTAAPIAAKPGLRVTKSAAGDDFTAGAEVKYTFVVANTGNVTVDGIGIDDPMTSDEACPKDALAAGEQMVCSATYTLTQADIDAGRVDNTVTVDGTDPSGRDVSGTGTNTFPAAASPKLTVAKTGVFADADGDGLAQAGEVVNYQIVVRNTGNVTVTDISVDDPLTGPPACDGEDLAPGQFVTCTVSYTLTQADVDAGSVRNSATASGSDPTGGDVSDEGSTVTELPGRSQLTLVKSAVPGKFELGSTINYQIVATNTGNTVLNDIAVDDPLTSDEACPKTTLQPGEQMVCTASYKVTEDDLAAGKVVNTATASGTGVNGVAVDSGVASAVFPVQETPELSVQKSGQAVDSDGDGFLEEGETVNFKILVTNTGNVPVKGLTVNDPITETPDCNSSDLQPGETATCTVSYTITGQDVQRGRVENTATASVDVAGVVIEAAGSTVVQIPARTIVVPPQTTGPDGQPLGQAPSPTAPASNNGLLGRVAFTGSSVVGFLMVAGAMLLSGSALLMLRRRRSPEGR